MKDLELGDENRSVESRECWSQACSSIMKQGVLEATNNVRISKAMEVVHDSHSYIIIALCANEHETNNATFVF